MAVSIHSLNALGERASWFRVYIANRPGMTFCSAPQDYYSLSAGEIFAIGQACGNGWRKVFNVYAKVFYALPLAISVLDKQQLTNWQSYRDQCLLQAGSGCALIFRQDWTQLAPAPAVHIIMGRTYARSLPLPSSLLWLDEEFALDIEHRIIVCPYFDYRQLSDRKIIRLVGLITALYQPESERFSLLFLSPGQK